MSSPRAPCGAKKCKDKIRNMRNCSFPVQDYGLQLLVLSLPTIGAQVLQLKYPASGNGSLWGSIVASVVSLCIELLR